MGMAITHFSVGAACTALCLAVLRPKYPYRTTVIALGGVWGLLPDAHWVVPVFSDELHVFHRHAPLLDVFWFHRVLDTHEFSRTRTFGALAVVVLCACVVFAEIGIPADRQSRN